MSRIASIFAELGLKKDKFDKGMSDAGQQGQKLGGTFSGVGSMIAVGFAAAGAAAIAFGAKAMQAADAQQKAEAGLLLALGNKAALQKDLIAQASELQGKTLFGDEVTVAAQRQLAVLKLTSTQIKDLIPVIQDFATVQGMDLVQAANLVGKAVATSTNALSRYGVELDSTMSKTEKAAEIQRIFNERYGGQAAKAAEVGTGPMKQMKNAMGDLVETIGILLNQNLGGFFKGMTKGLTDLNNILTEQSIPTWQKFMAIMFPSLKVEAQARAEAYKETVKARTEAEKALDIAKENLEHKKLELKEVRAAAAARKAEADAIASEKAKKAREEALKIAQQTAEAHKQGKLAVEEMYRVMISGVDEALRSGGFKEKVEEDIYDLTDYIEDQIGDIEPIKIPLDIEEANNKMEEAKMAALSMVQEMNDALNMIVADMIGIVAEGLIDLATGDQNLKGFFNNILSAFGSFIVQFGKMLIGYGIAWEAFKKAPGPVKIAAGIALIAIGKAISNLASKSPASGGGGYSTSGMSGGGGYSMGGSLPRYNSAEEKLVAEVSGDSLRILLDRSERTTSRRY